MVLFGLEVAGMVPAEAYMLAGFLEIALIAVALMARSAALDGRPYELPDVTCAVIWRGSIGVVWRPGQLTPMTRVLAVLPGPAQVLHMRNRSTRVRRCEAG